MAANNNPTTEVLAGLVERVTFQRQRFRARFLKSMAPTTTEGIEKYLGSGMIRGIGPAYARKLVGAPGSQVFDDFQTL
jgi:hypothetical protein